MAHQWNTIVTNRGSDIEQCTVCGTYSPDQGTCEEATARRTRNKEYWEYERLRKEMPAKVARYEYLKAKYGGAVQ
jgi:hypothetical protein